MQEQGQEGVEAFVNMDAEMAVIGTLLFKSDLFFEISETIFDYHFFSPIHQQIFADISSAAASGRSVNAVTLANKYRKDEDEGGDGANAYIASLAAKAMAPITLPSLAESVVDAWARRQIFTIGKEMQDAAADYDVNPPAIIDQIEADLYKTAGQDNAGVAGHAGEAAQESIKRAAAAYERGEVIGVTTGLEALDGLVGALMPGDVIVLGGATSSGKTSMAQQIALNVSLGGKVSEVFSLEMSLVEYINRHLAQRARVPAWRIETGKISGEEYAKLEGAKEWLESVPLWIDSSPSLTVSQMRSKARLRQRKSGLNLIVIDHLQFIRFENPRAPKIEGIEQVTRDIKALAKEMEVPVILVSHLSRGVSMRDEKTPVLSDLHGSSAIEKDADVVFFVHREEYWLLRNEPPAHDFEARIEWEQKMDIVRGKAEIILAKRRRGRGVGRRTLLFNESFTEFSDIPVVAESDPVFEL